MRVLFINASTAGSRYFPTGIATLMTILKEKRAEVSLFDTNFLFVKDRSYNSEYINLSDKIGQTKKVENDDDYMIPIDFSDLIIDLQKQIDNFEPEVIGISALSPSYPLAVELIKSVRIPETCKVAIGGTHCKVAGEKVIQEKCFDYVFEFEAEVSIPLLYDYLEGKKQVSLEVIDGIYWKKEDGTIVHNKLEKLPDLSNLPIINFDWFDNKYFTRPYDGKLKRIINYESSRGCPYKCTYCINNQIHNEKKIRKYYRRKSVDQIINELTLLIEKYQFEMIVFVDELFLNRPLENLKEFADSYEKHIGLPFTISTRPESINEEKVKLLKKMNCASVSIGVESGSPEIRYNILNRKMTNDNIIKAFDLLNQYKIRNSSLNIIGIPEESEENIWETIKLNKRANPTTISVSILYPYEGSPIREYCLDKGYLDKSQADNLVNPIGTSILNLPKLSEKKIKYYFDNFVSLCRTDN